MYHELRTSTKFKDGWNKFLLNLIGEKASPAFYQHVSHIVFRALIEFEYPLSYTTSSEKTSYQPLTYDKQNALRYVAGYVCREVRERLKLCSMPEKQDMILCLIELGGDELFEERGTETWTNIVDRGGLWHISDQTYSIFLIMEEVIRQHLTLSGISTQSENSRKSIMDTILNNEDLIFEWDIIAAEMEEVSTVNLLSCM